MQTRFSYLYIFLLLVNLPVFNSNGETIGVAQTCYIIPDSTYKCHDSTNCAKLDSIIEYLLQQFPNSILSSKSYDISFKVKEVVSNSGSKEVINEGLCLMESKHSENIIKILFNEHRHCVSYSISCSSLDSIILKAIILASNIKGPIESVIAGKSLVFLLSRPALDGNIDNLRHFECNYYVESIGKVIAIRLKRHDVDHFFWLNEAGEKLYSDYKQNEFFEIREPSTHIKRD